MFVLEGARGPARAQDGAFGLGRRRGEGAQR